MAKKKSSRAKSSKKRKSKETPFIPSYADFATEVPQTPPVGWPKSNSSICPYSDEMLETAGLMISNGFPAPLFTYSLHGAQIGWLLKTLNEETEKIIGNQSWADCDANDHTQLLGRALAVRGCLKLAFFHAERDELPYMLGQILQAATIWSNRDERHTRFMTDVYSAELRGKIRTSKAGLKSGPQAYSEKARQLREEAEQMARKLRDSQPGLTNHGLAFEVKKIKPEIPQKIMTIKRWFDALWPPRKS